MTKNFKKIDKKEIHSYSPERAAPATRRFLEIREQGGEPIILESGDGQLQVYNVSVPETRELVNRLTGYAWVSQG